MGKKKKNNKNGKQIEEVRRRWFDKIYSNIDKSIGIMKDERKRICTGENETKDIIDDIVVIGIYSLTNLKRKLKEKEIMDPSFRFYIYNVYDPEMLEKTFMMLASDLLGRETARKIFAAIVTCEISMRNRKNLRENITKAASKCCCETENLFH